MKKMVVSVILAVVLGFGQPVLADSVVRLYNPLDGNHWFTTKEDKVSALLDEGWQLEGVAFESSGKELPTYVLTSPTGYYHFTANDEEIDGLLDKGWRLGEIVFYASKIGQPVYRAYNPNNGTHHFTANAEELNHLESLGWRNEGVAYFVTNGASVVQPTTAVPVVGSNYFIDISSHNSHITVDEFLKLQTQGISGVVIKLTEGTSYVNPFAREQIKNARLANMKISVYHYSHYTSPTEAIDEARFFAQIATSLGMTSETLMVGDIEEDGMIPNINTNMEVWDAELHRLGFSNTIFYAGARWMDSNGGPIEVAKFGAENFWLAHYPKGYTYMTQAEAASYAFYSSFAAWQYTSSSPKLARPLDENIDYGGRFTR